jgi:hypothetical protein
MQTDVFDAFFEKLRKYGIGPGQIFEGLTKFDDTQLIDLVEELHQLLPICQYHDIERQTPYSFMANSGLSGLQTAPVDTLRLAQVDSLARFSVLYADTVFIQEPLSNQRFSKSGFPVMRKEVGIELAIMLALKPLLEAGIVKIASNTFPLNNFSLEQINNEIQRTVNRANTALRKRFSKNVTFDVSYIPRSGFRMTIAEGPLDLIENPSTRGNTGVIGQFSLETPPSLVKMVAKNDKDGLLKIKVNNRHPAFRDLFEELISSITRDLSFMALGSLLFDLNYITDRTADLLALESSNSTTNVALNRTLLEEFSHDMPIVFGAPLSALLKLRKKEWESFLDYRDALRQALRTVESDKQAKASTVFADIVNPELNRIDLSLKRNKSLLSKAAGRDAILAVGAVAMGLLTGFVSPQIADAIAKLGGLKYGIDTAKNLAAAYSEPKEAQENRYYFLWKARRMLKNYSQ